MSDFNDGPIMRSSGARFKVASDVELAELINGPIDSLLFAALRDLPIGHAIVMPIEEEGDFLRMVKMFPPCAFEVSHSFDGSKVIAVRKALQDNVSKKVQAALRKGEATAGKIANALRPTSQDVVFNTLETLVQQGLVTRYKVPHARNGTPVTKYALSPKV